jgi:hypothetical protein
MAAQLNSVQAEEAMAKILAVLDDDATQAKLLAIVREVNALPPQQQQMQKMGRLFPAVQEATAPVLAEYGFAKEQLMGFGMQMQAHAAASPAVKAGVARLMALMSGNGGLGEPPKGEGPPRGGAAAAAAPRVPTELASEAFDARCDLTIRPQNLCDMQMDKCDQLIGSEDRAAIASCVKHTRTRSAATSTSRSPSPRCAYMRPSWPSAPRTRARRTRTLLRGTQPYSVWAEGRKSQLSCSPSGITSTSSTRLPVPQGSSRQSQGRCLRRRPRG